MGIRIASLIKEGWDAGDKEVLRAKKDKNQTGDDQQAQQLTINLEDYMDEVLKLREMCEKYNHLISVFDCDEPDLDGYLISALLSSAGMDTPSDMLNLDQLEIAIKLNRADIARDKIFLDDKKWKKNALDQFMVQVILNDQDEFVSLLIEQGFKLEDFLSVHTLENLYTECLKRIDSKTELVSELWYEERIYKMDWVMLRDIGSIIRSLIGDFYEPLYLSKKFIDLVIEKDYDPKQNFAITKETMSKVSFRAKQIDFNKPLPIIRHDSELLAEISENALVSRGVPSLPSGMEKDEENEHHFVEAIQALQSKKSSEAYIPVPEIHEDQHHYFRLYAKGYVPPNQFIHIRTAVFADDEPVEYDMDSEDEKWLKSSALNISEAKFESMIEKLERGCGQKVMNLEEAKYLLQDDQSIIIAIYDYWLNKRVQCRQPLLLSVKQEKRDGTNNNTDPYIAFRRRTERMQTRKNRKNDENSFEKMLFFREQMETLDELFTCLINRERTKESIISNDRDLFQLRCKISDYDASSISEAESSLARFSQTSRSFDYSKKRAGKKRKAQWIKQETTKALSSDECSEEDISSLDNEFPFIRAPGVKYQKPLDGLKPSVELILPMSKRYNLCSVPFIENSSRHLYTGYVRRRLGRGGRLVLDRVSCADASYFACYDTELTCYDYGVTLPRSQIRHETSYENSLKDEERLQVSLLMNRLHLCKEKLRWSFRAQSPKSIIPREEEKEVLSKCKFDDRPEKDQEADKGQSVVSIIRSNGLKRNTMTSKVMNGGSQSNARKAVYGCNQRLVNGVVKKIQTTPTSHNGANDQQRSNSTNTARAC
ncbi:Enhancer of polycomb 2 [Cichlidogyrus casuarinus]|uniref:Enhancer of polycomb-like protein n=1 Tax=Cichlidogyrus casuarinus TaxID=1844966 RepID=A0ABD2QL65_9PLAT